MDTQRYGSRWTAVGRRSEMPRGKKDVLPWRARLSRRCVDMGFHLRGSSICLWWATREIEHTGVWYHLQQHYGKIFNASEEDAEIPRTLFFHPASSCFPFQVLNLIVKQRRGSTATHVLLILCCVCPLTAALISVSCAGFKVRSCHKLSHRESWLPGNCIYIFKWLYDVLYRFAYAAMRSVVEIGVLLLGLFRPSWNIRWTCQTPCWESKPKDNFACHSLQLDLLLKSDAN